MATKNEPEDLSFMDAHLEAAGVEVESATEGNASESGTDNASETSASSQDKVEGAAGKDSVSGASDGSTEQKPAEKKEGVVDPATVKPADKLPPGALKLQDGTIIQPGAERRIYDNLQLSRQRLQTTQNDLNTITQKHNALQTKYTELESTVRQIGLEDPNAIKTAVSLYKDLQNNPVEVVTKLLAELKAKGHTIDGIGSQVDTRAITEILDRRLKPSEQQQQRQTQEEIARQVETEVTDFLRDFSDAVVHEAYIAALVDAEAAKGNNLSLRDAYFALKERVINDGLDWSQPLGPQIQARKTPNGQQQQQQQVPRTQGRGLTPASEEIDPAKVITPDNDTSDAIVRAAMREAGLKA